MTVAMYDYRRTDVRRNTLANPYWLTSLEIDWADCEDKAAVLFSFPLAKYPDFIFMHQAMVLLTEAVAGAGTVVLDLGIYTLALDSDTTGGTETTLVDVNRFIDTGAFTLATPALYHQDAAATGIGTEMAAGAFSTAISVLTPVDADVPAICATMSDGAATLTGGSAIFYVLISEVPGCPAA